MPDLVPVDTDPFNVNLTPVDYDPFSAEQAGTQWLANKVAGGIAGLTNQPSWIEQATDLSQRQEAMRQAGATQGQIVQGTLDQAINVAPQFAGSINTDPLFHGSPQVGLRTLTESDRGPLGPGVYTSPSNQIAGHYAGDAGTIYQLPEQERDIFRGAGHRTDAEWFGFKDDKARLLNAAEPDKQAAVSAILDKAWSNDGYPVYQQLVRLYGSNDAAQALYKRAGFQGLSGLVDGPETLLFGNQPLTQGIRAFHGSPYDFDRFDLSKIGTGEGAQAYGHGLYFAENPAVAEAYKNDPKMMSFARGKDWSDDQEEASKWLSENGYDTAKASADIAKRISQAKMYADSPESTASLNQIKAIIDSGWQPPKGRMYEVNIAADPEHFLDWDKPLSEQSPQVQAILRQQIQNAGGSDRYKAEKFLAAPTKSGLDDYKAVGSQIYSGLATDSQSGLSQRLKEAGIPGIKYLDQGSRGKDYGPAIAAAQQRVQRWANDPAKLKDAQNDLAQLQSLEAEQGKNQTSNYVVFDDSLISILKKYGLAGLIAGGAAHFKTTPVDHNPF